MGSYKLKFTLLLVPILLSVGVLVAGETYFYKLTSDQVDIVLRVVNAQEKERAGYLNSFLLTMLIMALTTTVGALAHLLSSLSISWLRILATTNYEERYLEGVVRLPERQLPELEGEIELFSRFREGIRYIVNQRIGIYTYSLQVLAQFLATLALTFYLNWIVAIFLLVSSLFHPVYTLLSRRFEEAQVAANQARRSYINRLEEALDNYPALYYFNQRFILSERTANLSREEVKLGVRLERRRSLLSLLQQGVNSLIRLVLLVAMVSIYYYLPTSGLTVGMIAAISYYFLTTTTLLSSLVRGVIELRGLRAVEGDIKFELMADGAGSFEGSISEIKLTNLALRYGESEVFSCINLCFKSGKIYGIVGSSGSGKSSLARILAGLITHYEGEAIVTSEGGARAEIRDLESSFFRTKVSLLPAIKLLFEGSVRDNITLFELGGDEEGYKGAIKAADLHPLSLEREFSRESALALSEGQQQRVSIARLLTHLKEVVILDEPFANLDPESVKRVVGNLLGPNSPLRGRLVILISHQEIDPNLHLFDEVINLEELRFKPNLGE